MTSRTTSATSATSAPHVFALCALLSFATALPAAPLANQLRNDPSPYLAMHSRDPVAWQHWDRDRLLARARREGKLIYVSVGYFSCHWCHVMQRESYRDKKIAAFLNRHFIPVKVDRELDPALDTRLMEFVQNTRGVAGWPLNVFLTPEGAPLYGVLYLPPAQFLSTLERLQALWRADPARLRALAEQALPQGQGPGAPRLDPARTRALAQAFVAQALKQADSLQGGFGEQSKFPSVPQLSALLALLDVHPDKAVRAFLTTTLDAMADGGLQDHLGGGFFRYTVDPAWRRPHFEKMLYDNAQLAMLYLRAAHVLDAPRYARIARRTLDFMLDRMQAGDGAFIASLSALDGRGVEGGYYLWDKQELARVLDRAQLALVSRVYGLDDPPAFEAGYLLIPTMSVEQAAGRLGVPADAARAQIESAHTALLRARARRTLPRDTKRLAAWNGLALSAFARAAQSTGEARYRAAAAGVRDYLVTRLWDGARLRRAVAHGRDVGQVSLEDYAYVSRGLADYAALTRRREEAALAARVTRVAWSRFYGARGWRVTERPLLTREETQTLIPDAHTPSPSAVLCEVSLRLAAVLHDNALRQRALGALNVGAKDMVEDPYWYATQIEAGASIEERGAR